MILEAQQKILAYLALLFCLSHHRPRGKAEFLVSRGRVHVGLPRYSLLLYSSEPQRRFTGTQYASILELEKPFRWAHHDPAIEKRKKKTWDASLSLVRVCYYCLCLMR